MSVKFETINGQLCRMVEPVPLILEATFPCVVRFVQDDPSTRLTWIARCIKQNPLYRNSLCAYEAGRNGFCSCISDINKLEIIGYPVAEGSKEWALHQMMQGKAVTFFCKPNLILKLVNGYIQDSISGGYWDRKSGNEFLSYAARDGWLIHKPEPKESPIDPIERPLRKLILQAKENGKNIRTYYQNMIFTPDALTGLLAKGRFRWWNICNWELTDKEQNYYPPIKLVKPEPEPKFKVGDWVEHKKSKEQGRITYISSDNYDAIEVKLYDQDELETYTKSDFNADFRKLKSSEVVLDFGNGIKGRVCMPDGEWGFAVLDDNNDWIAQIDPDALDAQTCEIVERLLKAQEE